MRKPKLVCRNFNGKLLGVYNTVQEAADDLLVDAEGIVKAVSTKTFQKCDNNYYIWSREMLDATVNANKDNRGCHRHIKTSVPVVQIDLKTHQVINEYHSMYEALRQTGISTIARVCKGLAKSAGGYSWMFKSDYDKQIEDLM